MRKIGCDSRLDGETVREHLSATAFIEDLVALIKAMAGRRKKTGGKTNGSITFKAAAGKRCGLPY